MKIIYVILFLCLFCNSCSRDYKNPLETDNDVSRQPEIVQVQKTTDQYVSLSLNNSYSANAEVILERKVSTAFESIPYIRQSQSVLVDTSLNKESDYDFIYRIKVTKDLDGKEYSTGYSNEVSYQYTSTVLNDPTDISLQTLELQGIRLTWTDRTNKETGYKVEKNSGSGYAEIASLPPNTTSYMDNINGIQNPALNLSYRVKAYNATLSSLWKEATTIYAGLGSPTNLKILDSAFYKFTIGWTRNSSIATGYAVERKKDNGSFVELATVGPTISLFIDTTIADSGSYTYRVRTKKDNSYSPYTNEVLCSASLHIPTNGLVAFYPFNGNTNDGSGNGNNGTNNGATLTTDRFGRSNKAYSFDGISNYIEISNNGIIKNTGAFSICIWIKPRSSSGTTNAVLYNGADGQEGAYGIDFLSNKFRFFIRLNSQWYTSHSSTTIDYNSLYFVVGLVNGNSIKVFVNGINENTVSYSGILPVNNSTISIGRHNNSSYRYYSNCIVDDIRIYNRALTDAEIQALYHEGGWK